MPKKCPFGKFWGRITYEEDCNKSWIFTNIQGYCGTLHLAQTGCDTGMPRAKISYSTLYREDHEFMDDTFPSKIYNFYIVQQKKD